MIKSPLLVSTVLTLSASLLMAGNGLANDTYDVRANGPKNDIVWETPIKATFKHSVHTAGAGLECSSCHDEIFSMQRGTAVNSKKFNMKAMADGQFCGSCHDGDTAFATDTNCMECHRASEEPISWQSPTKVSFSHNAHVEEFDLECANCHDDIFAMKKGAAAATNKFTMSSFKEGKYCGSCHNGDDAFDTSSQCESCHFPPTEKIVFTKPVQSVVFEHKIHVGKAGLSCGDCHKEVFAMKQGTVESQELVHSDDPAVKRKHLVTLHNKFCGTCHDSSQAFGYLTKCTICHIGVKGYKQMNPGSHQDTEETSQH
jgi:c(7)-type cytochrome triheme protein